MHTRARVLGVLLVLCAVGAGLGAIYLSADYAQHFALREGPLPSRYPHAAIAAFVAAGLLLAIAVVLRPALFWPALVGTAIATGGMFVLGFPIFDEWLTGCLAVGAAAALARGSVPLRPDGFRRLWVWLFIALSVYLIAEGVRGLVLYHNLKAVRPILDAAIILSIGVLLARYEFPRPPGRKIIALVAASGAAYLALYLLHGVAFSKLVFGRQIMEGIGGAERAFATFPIAVTVPAAILLLRFARGWHWLLGLGAIVLAVDVSFLSGSRAGILATVVFFTAASLRGGLKLTANLCLSLLVAFAILIGVFHYDPVYALYRAEGILSGLRIQHGGLNILVFRGTGVGRKAVVAYGDANRHILNQAAILALRSDAQLLLIGAGTYGYWPRAGRFVSALRAKYGVPDTVVNYASTLGRGAAEPPRPPAWPVFIAETGVAGLLLVLGNAFAALRHTLLRKRPSGVRGSLQLAPVMVAVSLLALLAWGYFAELQTKMLLYLMVMPHGMLDGWSTAGNGEGAGPEAAKGIRLPEMVPVP